MSDELDVLLVEDEADLAAATADYLRACGLNVCGVHTAEEALAVLRRCVPAVVLLDVNLPGASGFDLCRRLRALPDSTQPSIIFVSARASDVDQVQGLALGADDFVTKPFSLAVLVAKVRRALDRRAAGAGATTWAAEHSGEPGGPGAGGFEDAHLRVDLAAGRAYAAGKELQLTALEDRILRYLVANCGSVCSKAQIIREVWGDQYTSEGTLSVHIRRLRTRIEPHPETPTYIHTVWGRGYMFEARA